MRYSRRAGGSDKRLEPLLGASRSSACVFLSKNCSSNWWGASAKKCIQRCGRDLATGQARSGVANDALFRGDRRRGVGVRFQRPLSGPGHGFGRKRDRNVHLLPRIPPALHAVPGDSTDRGEATVPVAGLVAAGLPLGADSIRLGGYDGGGRQLDVARSTELCSNTWR